MLDNELVDMVKQIQLVRSESNKIEIKAANKGCPKVRDSLSSFSNQSGGGVIIFGVDEHDGYAVCGVYDAADLMKKVEAQCQEMTPVIRPLFSVASIDGKTVVSAEIQEIDNADKPCFYSGVGRLKGSYVRSGDADRLMTEYEVYSYEAFKKSIHDELRTCERTFEKDIQTNAFKLYFDLLKSKKPNLAELSNEEICRLQGFTDEGKPTLAGIMLFSNYPQAFIDNQRIDGTLVQMLNDALVFVRKNMKTATIIDPNTGKRTDKTEYPVIAIRELILNALIHRDYSIHTDTTPITIKMFSDRFEIENPGGLYGIMTLDRLGKVSADTRNPKIAGAMEILGETENRYSGIPTIINAMEESVLPAPKFESDRGVFKVTLYNSAAESVPIDDIETEILEFCKTPRSRNEIAEFFNGRRTIAYVMERYVKPMIASGRLIMTIPEKPKSKYQKFLAR